MEMLVYAISLSQTQRRRPRSTSEAAHEEDAFYARAQPGLMDAVRVLAAVGGLALYAALLGLAGH